MGKSGFTFEGSGRLDRIDIYHARSGKDIVTLVLQVEGTYPQLVPVKCFGRLGDEARDLTVGDVVEVSGHLGGRDSNGRVWGDIVGERLEVVVSAAETRGEAPSGRGWGQGQQQTMPGTGGAKHRDVKASDEPPPLGDDDLIPF